ncbi:hypothetical protein J4439_02820 [Candidatus Woesearchaeota archaeon]|nr:hypothetical protein [Candidatus Woesearchaeota archaeon]
MKLEQRAPRPSPFEMAAPQQRHFLRLEEDFTVTRPLFLNTPRSWADTLLVRAAELTDCSIGRYRLAS